MLTPLKGGRHKDVYFNWRDVLFLSGGRHLENEMYISSGKMYILTGDMYISSTSHQLKYTSFHLKYTSHSVSSGRQIYLVAAT